MFDLVLTKIHEQYLTLLIQESDDEPLETLYIEEDELVLPHQADVFIRTAQDFLNERNSTRKKRKIRNFLRYPVSQWSLPIRYKIDNTFSTLYPVHQNLF